MIETKVTPEQFDCLIRAKTDKSWDRYNGGRRDLVDRYDMTVALVRGNNLLDIGCAESLLAQLVRSRRPDVQRIAGIDANPRMIFESKKRLGLKSEVMTGYAENLPYTVGEFNTVVLGQTLEHVYEVQQVADEAIRVLAVGGRLIVNVPANDTQPHNNHLRVFESIDDLKNLFGTKIFWEGWGIVHTFLFAWGERV
jgi:ubiquinone/menaquinone biosynthesis C-methylase UbiE